MKKDFDASRLDVTAFAQAGALLEGDEPLSAFERLQAEAASSDLPSGVQWRAQGEWRSESAGTATPWVHVQAQACVPLTCQRCLQPMAAQMEAQRWFRFVADEETAALEDEEAEEDVLVISKSFDLRELVEDELLMELPVAPRHEQCPTEMPMSVQDEDFDAAQAQRPNPFAALAQLKKKPGQIG